MKYIHANVFSSKALSGNGVTVVFIENNIDDEILQKIAQELKQYETVFVYPEKQNVFLIRIFTVQEEIPFAGHPVIGTAAVIHKIFFPEADKKDIDFLFEISGKGLTLKTKKQEAFYSVEMNQGKADFISVLKGSDESELLKFTSLVENDIDKNIPIEVVSTGLPYLLVPLKKNIQNAVITKPGFENFLKNYGAKFSYFFQTDTLECRSWDNSGMFEDVATGSAAGPLASYLVKHNLMRLEEAICLKQGRFCGRPSRIDCVVNKLDEVLINGDVSIFAEGEITIPAR